MDSKEKKQQYLKDEILESGYDGMIFANFLCSKRENGKKKILFKKVMI